MNYFLPVDTTSTEVWPARWRIALGFCVKYNLLGKADQWHTGVDFVLRDGPTVGTVHSIADGVIVSARKETSSWGNLVVVDHGECISRYAHLKWIGVRKGEEVSGGKLLGEIGKTGGDRIPGWEHLHFDISSTRILKTNPIYWPGLSRNGVLLNFVNPKVFLSERISPIIDVVVSDSAIPWLNVRYAAGVTKVVGKLYPGDRVSVRKSVNGWCKIVDGKYKDGYISSRYIEEKSL